jgi:hypothetical protein
MAGDDLDLRERFAALRQEEAAQTPEFDLHRVPARERRRRLSPARIFAVTACVAVAVSVALWLRPASSRQQPEPGSPVVSITEWKAPTDFLLETPGRDLLRTVPAIGAWDEDVKAPNSAMRSRQVKRQALP